MGHEYSATEATSVLHTWLVLHWVRVVVTLIAAVYAIKGFEKMKTSTEVEDHLI